MNKIVREHYPVEKLPQDLRSGVPPGASVTVTITLESDQPRALDRDTAVALMRKMQAENRDKGVTMEEAVARVRELRDEWEDQ